ncbi:LysR family transcriptional regulator [Xanthobacter sp. TB0139]|uniref:LysR family transcriptional regulator n=1 Tax=Xanthobacter sp. TB0139 TaxID=3459178 RepID=UPI00403A53E0
MASLIQTLAVAEYLNFRHAAKALGAAQSSVSARVKALEDDLGILLFERHARGVRLTDAGRHFVEQVTVGIDQLDHAVKTASMVGAGRQGRLRIGICALTSGGFLDQLLSKYREVHPGIDIDMTEGTARKTMMQLRADRLDIVFVAGAPEPPDFHARCIWAEPLIAALPDHHPLAGNSAVAWPDLSGETFLVRHGGTGPQAYDHILLRFAGNFSAPTIQRLDVGRSALLSMVAQGFGITIVGAATSLMPASGVTFLPFSDELEPVPFSAVWSPFNRSAALRNLLDLANAMERQVRTG